MDSEKMEKFGLEDEFKAFGEKARARTEKTNNTVKKALGVSGFMALSPLVGVLAVTDPSIDTSTLVALGTALTGAVATGITGFAHMFTAERAENMEKVEKLEKYFLKALDKEEQEKGQESYKRFVGEAMARGDDLATEIKKVSKTFKKAAKKRESLVNGNNEYDSLLCGLKEGVENLKVDNTVSNITNKKLKL